MAHSIGKTIKELRRSLGMTQEELAEKIGVTAQAVSKWENELGLPDISQIVPLSHVFGVSADTLLGTGDIKRSDDVNEILERAHSKLCFPLTVDCLWEKYKVLTEGLKRYPSSFALMINCMELEISLAYPENPTYDKENSEKLYASCLEHGNTIILYDQDVNRVLRARMIMLMLHLANGRLSEARSQAKKFPTRVDFNIHKMYSLYAHWQKDYDHEISSYHFYIMNIIWAFVSASVSLAKAYGLADVPDKAAEIYERLIEILEVIFKGENKMPFHHAEGGDIYVLLAEEKMARGDKEGAIYYLEKAVDYDIIEKEELIESNFKIESPFLSTVGGRLGDRFQDLDGILTQECFVPLREDKRYIELCRRVGEFKERTKK